MRCEGTVALAAACCAALLVAGAARAAEQGGFAPAEPGRSWRFPEDHWADRRYRNEWWYYTGNLDAAGDASRRFAFQLTFFRVGFLPAPQPLESSWSTAGAVMGHAAITDLKTREHWFAEVLWREVPLLGGFGVHPDPVIAWARAPAGTEGRWSVRWNGRGFDLSMQDRAQGIGLALAVVPAKPVVFQGPGGFSRKSSAPGFASLYYSYTRLDARGTVTVHGEPLPVRGSAWMDREMGSSQLAPGQVGWDWWSLQLADGRDVMLYRLRRADGSVDFAYGTVVDRSGGTRWLAADAWSVRPKGTWRSPETGAEYPSTWRIAVPSESIDVTVQPRVAAQENVARLAGGLFYWEGSVRVVDGAGAEVGEGFVELTGYGRGNRPPL